MGLLGSTFGRALAGAGAAAVELSNKYIDDDLATKRAQTIADIQRTSAVQQAKELDANVRDPARLAAIREEAARDAIAVGASADTVAMNRASNQPLTLAQIAQKNAVTQGTADVDAEVAGKMERAKAENQAHDVAPGGEVIIGKGSNNRPTMIDAYREGWKQSNKESRDRLTEATMSDLSKQAESLNTIIAKGIAEGSLSTEADPDGKNKAQLSAYRELKGQLAAIKLQQQQIRNIAHGSAEDTDPAGLRGARSPVTAADIQKDAQATGTQDYDMDIGGKKTQVRGGKAAPAAPPAPADNAVSKDWVGPGWTWNGKPFKSKAEAEAARDGGGGAKPATKPAPGEDAGGQTWRDTAKSLFEKSAAMLSPDWDQQGMAAISSGDKSAMRRVLEQSQGSSKPLSPETERKLRAALGAR